MKGEIVCKHYSPDTIYNISNIKRSMNSQEEVQAALQLLQSDYFNYRVAVKSDKLAMTDFARQKNERVGWMDALGGLITSSAPLMQQSPAMVPFILQAVKWTMASFEGSSEIQGVLDQAIAQMEKEQQQGPQQPQDPKLLAAQAKGQVDMQKAQFDAQSKQQQTQLESQTRMQEISAETQSDIAKQAAQATYNTQEELAKTRLEMEKSAMDAHRQALMPVPVKPRPPFVRKPGQPR